MVTVTKKHQTSMALIAVVLATVMIAGTLAMGNNAFAWRGDSSKHGQDNNGKDNNVKNGLDNFGSSSFGGSKGQTATSDQSIAQSCDQNQNSPVTTGGAVSPPILSGINLGLCVNANAGGNAANQDQGDQR
jgi:hypothetical protein